MTVVGAYYKSNIKNFHSGTSAITVKERESEREQVRLKSEICAFVHADYWCFPKRSYHGNHFSVIERLCKCAHSFVTTCRVRSRSVCVCLCAFHKLQKY